MMGKYNFISSYFIVAIIVLYIGSTVNALVGNICTSEMMNQLDNITTTEVTIKVKEKEWDLESKISVKVDVGEKRFIRNIIIWAETVDGEQPGTHIGYWIPISEHVYVDGCNGPANATISNQVDLNLSQMTYEWNPPSVQNYEPPETPVTPTPTSPQPSTSPPVQSTSSSNVATSASPSPTECNDDDKHDHDHYHHHHYRNYLYNKVALTSIVKPLYPRQEMATISMKNQMNYLAFKKVCVGSIVFKGVIQLMNHTDDEIYSFESHVIKDNSDNENILNKLDNSDPKVSPSSASNSKFILNSFATPGVLILIISFLTY